MTEALVSASCKKPWSVHPDKSLGQWILPKALVMHHDRSLGQCILQKALVSASCQKPWSVHPAKSLGQCILTKHQAVPYMKDHVLVDFVHVCLALSAHQFKLTQAEELSDKPRLPMCSAGRHETMSWMMTAHYRLFSPTITVSHVISVIKNERKGTWFVVSNIRCFNSGLGIYIVGVWRSLKR